MPATKRACTDDVQPLIRSADVWFDDGNVILIAESTQFKVFRGILSASSPIFQDMFSLSTEVPEESIDGCPVVHLSDTTADVSHMLRALHDRRYFRDQGFQPIVVIGAILRLGMKYNITHFVEDATARLQSEFPHSLGEYEKLPDGWVAIEEAPGNLLDVIALAWETKMLSTLPVAFYCFCLGDDFSTYLLKGKIRSDHSTAILSSEDQRRCIFGKEKLIQLQAETSFGWLHTSSNCGVTRRDCEMKKLRLFASLWSPSPELCILDAWSAEWEVGLCASCIDFGREAFEAGKQGAWSKLPSFFDLPPWNELIGTS
ncbi:hypothetical protein JAAARDRAFT_58838 [Jaapia argillacea MUCL 33604]|uniref:BTB domain-containing protein n=1 Tax=Jaapia argillacea MUCL 33604 TaxID=933084 RepID=A0A067PRS5_9AGAM|nr:hypothetical protein JAAARDRAFT_58838 [Jaapia argillacea MUCL 33604]